MSICEAGHNSDNSDSGRDGTKLYFIAEDQRKISPKEPFSGRSPRGWRAPKDSTLFVGNVPFR